MLHHCRRHKQHYPLGHAGSTRRMIGGASSSRNHEKRSHQEWAAISSSTSLILEEPLCVADCRFSSENFGAAAGAHQYIRADDFFHITITLLSNSDASDDKKHHEKFPLKITQPCVFVLSFWRKNSILWLMKAWWFCNSRISNANPIRCCCMQ